MHRKLRNLDTAVLLCLVTDRDQIGGSRVRAMPAFLMHRKLRDPYAAVLLCFVTDMDQIGGRRGLSVPAFCKSIGIIYPRP